MVGTVVFSPASPAGAWATGPHSPSTACWPWTADVPRVRNSRHVSSKRSSVPVVRSSCAACGPQGHIALTRLARNYSSDVNFPAPATNLVTFGRAVDFPLIFGAILILFGAGTLLHVLAVRVPTRPGGGPVQGLGFVRRQVAFTVCWQTTIVALIGIVIGVPAGIAVGRGVWDIFAHSVGVLTVTMVTAGGIVAVAPLSWPMCWRP